MKKSLNIFVVALVVVLAQACGSPSSKNEEQSEAKETASVLTSAERRAKVDKERAERIERKRAAMMELARTMPSYTDVGGYIVFNKAEVDPAYEGGEEAMEKFLNDNIQYPKEAEDKGAEGTVIVDFVIGTNGMVRDVVVNDEEGEIIDPSLRAEAIRLVSSMPRWTPGRQHGKPVDVKFTLPVTFHMM